MKSEKLAAAVVATSDFLRTEAAAQPARDGWFTISEVCKGVRDAAKLGMPSVSIALTHMVGSVPPLAEDAWMNSTPFNEPILTEQFAHPDQPATARRYYRGLQSVELTDQ